MTRSLLPALVLAATLAATAAPVATPAPAPAAAERAQATFCLGTGAPWRRGTSRGSRYAISLGRGVTCAFARTWVARLSAKAATRPAQTLRGPAGFTCVVTLPYSGKAAVGACGRAGGKGFGWAPKWS